MTPEELAASLRQAGKSISTFKDVARQIVIGPWPFEPRKIDWTDQSECPYIRTSTHGPRIEMDSSGMTLTDNSGRYFIGVDPAHGSDHSVLAHRIGKTVFLMTTDSKVSVFMCPQCLRTVRWHRKKPDRHCRTCHHPLWRYLA